MKLKPCPFCGGEAKVSDVFGRAGVICKDCLAEMRGYLGMTEVEAIEQWNRREPIDKVVEQLEEKFLAEKNFRAKGCWLDAIEIVKLGGKA